MSDNPERDVTYWLGAMNGGLGNLGAALGYSGASQQQMNLAQQQNAYTAMQAQLGQMLGAQNYMPYTGGIPPPVYRPPRPPRCEYCGVRYATRVGTCTSCGAPL